MRILQIAPIDRRVPPLKYGAIERVVSWLVDGLVSRGHKVFLLASSDSQTSGELIPIVDVPLCDSGCGPKAREPQFSLAVARALEIIHKCEVDIVHNHLGWRLLPFARLIRTPFLTTLQIPLDSRDKAPIFDSARDAPIVCVSESQRLGRADLNVVACIPNGVPLDLFAFSSSSNGYLAFLGRMAPEKGAVEAIQIARALNKTLIMGAAVHDWEQGYFREQVAPLIDGVSIKYVGELTDAEKNVLLGGAEGLLNPIQWDEPFGIACVEAMACGTPILTIRRGAMPEVVVDGRTGILAENAFDLIRRFPEIKSIRRVDCRAHVEDHFSVDRMIEEYLSVYDALRTTPEASRETHGEQSEHI